MRLVYCTILAIAAIACVTVRYSCHKPAATKPSPAVTVEKPDETCHCGKPQCNDPDAWNWYVENKVEPTGVFCWERDKGKWSWVWYGNPVSASQSAASRATVPFQSPARRFGASCPAGGCR